MTDPPLSSASPAAGPSAPGPPAAAAPAPCPWCRGPVVDEAGVVCGGCLVRQHRRCWHGCARCGPVPGALEPPAPAVASPLSRRRRDLVRALLVALAVAALAVAAALVGPPPLPPPPPAPPPPPRPLPAWRDPAVIRGWLASLERAPSSYFALDDHVIAIRRLRRALPPPGPLADEIVRALMAKLDASPAVALAACEALAERPEAIEPLVAALAARRPEQVAAQVLERDGGPPADLLPLTLRRAGDRAVPALERLLREGAPDARRNAALTLALIGSERARDLLRPFLDDPDELLREAARAGHGRR